MTNPDAQDPQVRLSEYLQILDHYGYNEEQSPYSELSRWNKRGRDRDIDRELKVLDVIALCLTTGQSGDVVAATFEKHSILTILLSKNHASSATDHEQASLFFNALLDRNNARVIDIIAVIATYAGINMNKRVEKVKESMDNMRSHIATLIDRYHAGPRENEFHDDDPLLSIEPDVRKSLQLALDQLSDLVTDFDIDSIDRLPTLENFHTASIVAYFLTKTRFIRSEAENPTCHPSFGTFQRRLAKLGQYSRGIRSLLVYRNRLSGQLPAFQWVDFPRDEPLPVEIAESPLDVACRVMEINATSPEYRRLFWQYYPIPIERWRGTVTPVCHAEMRLILSQDLGQEFVESIRPIGCSKRSCLCCWHWINSYNFTHHTKWMTTGSHGKPHMNWGLSGDTAVDLTVVAAMRQRVLDTLEWMKGGKRHASSSGSSPDSEGPVPQADLAALTEKYARRSRR